MTPLASPGPHGSLLLDLDTCGLYQLDAPEPRRPPAEREVEELRARLRAIKDHMTLEGV